MTGINQVTDFDRFGNKGGGLAVEAQGAAAEAPVEAVAAVAIIDQNRGQGMLCLPSERFLM
jgi:hypothetical protein